jgi:hypothetical protein
MIRVIWPDPEERIGLVTRAFNTAVTNVLFIMK